MLGREEQMQPGFVDFQNFAQGFCFAGREAIFRPGIPKSNQVGFRQDRDTGVAGIVEIFSCIIKQCNKCLSKTCQT